MSVFPYSFANFHLILSDNKMVSIETLSIVFTVLSISLAAFYIFTLRYTRMNMKNTLETRQAQCARTRMWEKFIPIIDEGREYFQAPRWFSET